MKCNCGFEFTKSNHSLYLSNESEWFRVCPLCGESYKMELEKNEYVPKVDNLEE